MDRLQQSLQKLFGFELFRPKQRDVIELILKKRHTLAVLPTGLGKSLCYQLTAQLQSGITLVISPLIALMQDQVDGLMRHGIKNATFISSTLDPSEVGARYKDIEKGKYNLLYVAPERFDSLRFQEIIRKTNIDLLVIDEAHCISKWGHDFRPHYRTLSQRLPEIKHSTILALTATATPAVQDDIIKTLNQPNMERIIGDFNRPNLHLEVFRFNRRKEKDEKLIELLSDEKGSVIIYSSTIKETRIVFDLLRNYEFNISLYHGRLNSKDRIQAHYDFQNDKTQIIIATVAFGMGIDKPDIRRIIHYNIPGSLESYYQEIGRAGRDGKPAICTLLFLQNDLRVQRFFIDQAYPKPEQIFEQYKIIHEAHPLPVSSEDIAIASGYIELSVNSALHMLYEQDFIKIMPDGKYLLMRPEIKAPSIDFKPFDKRKAQDNSRLRKMVSYTDYKTCKRQHILSYFEQDFIPPCNNCDVCTPQQKGSSVKFSEKETEKATTESDKVARTILQAACDFGGRLGRTTISDTLFGSKRKNILNFKLNRSRSYGQLQSYDRRLILKWVDELIYMDLLYVTAEEYPKLKITDKGLQALKNETLIALSGLGEALKKIDVISIKDEHITVTSTERRENIEFNSQLYEKLRDWRLQKTKSLKLPAYCILYNSTLKEITRQCPCRLEELKYIKGIGKRKMEQFGSEIIDLIKNNIESIKSITPQSATINKHEPVIDEGFSKKQAKKSYKQEIIKLLREGKLSSKEIAEKVGVSPPTIWAYKAHLTMGTYDKQAEKLNDEPSVKESEVKEVSYSKEYLSTSALAKKYNLQSKILYDHFVEIGWVRKEGVHRILTEEGNRGGGRYKKQGKMIPWIIWPSDILDKSSSKDIVSIKQKIYNHDNFETDSLTTESDQDRLDNSQKQFINNKVIELGSIEAVKIFYSSESSVCKYARKRAVEVYKKNGH